MIVSKHNKRHEYEIISELRDCKSHGIIPGMVRAQRLDIWCAANIYNLSDFGATTKRDWALIGEWRAIVGATEKDATTVSDEVGREKNKKDR